MVRVLTKILIFLTLFTAGTAHALESKTITSDQVEVQLIAGGYDEGTINLGLHYKIQPGWHIYWRTPGDNGFPPMLNWDGSKNVEDAEMLWPVPKRHRYKATDDLYFESNSYEDEVIFPIKLSPQNPNAATDIKLNVSYAICSDICIPAEADISLEILPSYFSAKNSELIAKYTKLVPKPAGHEGIEISEIMPGKDGDEKYLQVTFNNSIKQLKDSELFIEEGENFVFYNPQIMATEGNKATFKAPITFLTNDTSLTDKTFTITLANGANSIETKISGSQILNTHSTGNAVTYDLLLILLLGFVGGLILNVMPCVLPVLSIKLLGVVKYGGGDKAHVAASFIITALGIIISFLALAGLVIILRSIGMNVGWGFHFQEPFFIITLVIILTFFAASMWGFYEIKLPVGIGGAAYKKSEHHSLLGHFLTGVFATILATPCTAPFLGTAVGFALSRGTFEILSTFTAMGIGLATPYLFFSIFPGAITKLPKPGQWMVRVKHIMGFLLAATAIWLIWVLSNQLGKMAAIVLLVLVTIKILKLWAANHIDFLAKKSVRIIILGTCIILAFLIPIKISDNMHTTNNGKGDIWEEFRPQDIGQLVAYGKIVFVDVTADWCLTCKANKFFVLDSDDIIKEFKQLDVVAMKADWTNKNDHITEYLQSHNRVGIPFNIVYGPSAPEGIILSELLSKDDVLEAIEKAK